jgi:hypothetical protein
MTTPTIREAIEHLREHYHLTMAEVLALVRTPLHPAALRDEFAGRAMQGLLAAGWEANYTNTLLTIRAYEVADDMLAARLPKEPS